MGALGFLEPLADKLLPHILRLDKRMCHMEEMLANIADNTRAGQYLNDWQLRYISADGELALRNDTGFGWLVHWVSNGSKDTVSVFIGQSHGSRKVATLGEEQSGETRWYVPPLSEIIVEGLTSDFVTFQIETLNVTALKAKTGRSGERIEVSRTQPQPDASVLNDEEG